MPDRDAMILPSRRTAWSRLTEAVSARTSRTVLLTGEAGSGKTWLTRRVVESASPRQSWAWVDLGPEETPTDLIRSILAQLGWTGTGGEGNAGLRIVLGQVLGDAAVDGREWGLVVDELQLATPATLEELRILSNKMGRSDGFCQMMLVGQSRVLRALSSWGLGSIGTRVDEHIHLTPLDADDARAWSGRVGSSEARSLAEIESLHRDSGGNAALLSRLLRSGLGDRNGNLRKDPGHGPLFPKEQAPVRELLKGGERVAMEPSPVPLLPARPPLIEDEGLIEVGWTPEAAESSDAEATTRVEPDEAESVSEVVEDAYTALQAWQEWAASAARVAESVGGGSGATSREGEGPEADSEGNVWLDPAESFAPYGDLFTRNRPATPSDG